jgi:hypothetical protein
VLSQHLQHRGVVFASQVRGIGRVKDGRSKQGRREDLTALGPLGQGSELGRRSLAFLIGRLGKGERWRNRGSPLGKLYEDLSLARSPFEVGGSDRRRGQLVGVAQQPVGKAQGDQIDERDLVPRRELPVEGSATAVPNGDIRSQAILLEGLVLALADLRGDEVGTLGF